MAELAKSYKIFNVENYSISKSTFNELIKNGYKEFDNINDVVKELNKRDHYHFRITKDTKYIFFGDLDHYINGIEKFRDIMMTFMKEYYNLSFEEDDFKFTVNDKKIGSYHYTIPKWNLSTEKLKEIHSNLLKIYKNEFTIQTDKKTISCVDTSNYASGSGHWFRCPNQLKGNETDGIHIIKSGTMEDFIIDYIPSYSININDITMKAINTIDKKSKKTLNNGKLVVSKKVQKNDSIIEKIDFDKQDTELILTNKTYNDNNELILSTSISQPNLYKKMFDECYNQDRFEVYKYWISVGMAIKNTFSNDEEAIELFNYFSSKGRNYDGLEQTTYKYKTFIQKVNTNGYTVATIYYYAIEDNKQKFVEIMSKNSFDLEQTDICKYLKIIAGYKFIYKMIGDQYKLYCYNGKYWQTDDILMKKCISTELYDFLKNILVEVYWNQKDFQVIKKKLDKLKTLQFKKDIVETYKEFGVNNDIKFDDKWWLLGFNNLVYDMESEQFREYKYDDYISMTCGYDWIEPTEEELETINTIIKSIMPIEEERNLYLQILCTALEGRCLEKFVVFNGGGGNGKGLMNDLLLTALGQYGILANNGILFETSKTGSNPEKANIHKKRLVIFREPPEKNKFENSIVKELTGGGTFSARSHHEKETEKELNLTMIVECNKKPLFSEEPKDAELRRLIDLYFRSTFTTDVSLLDPSKYIFMANSVYKTKDFQNKHKCALIKILLEEHKKYKKNNYCFHVPKTVVERTQTYLEMSCNIVQWFKDNYEHTGNNTDICKIKDIYEDFSQSSYYFNLSKMEKRKYNKSFFINYIEENIFFRKYYVERYNNIRNNVKEWKKKEIDFEDNYE